MIQRSHFRWWMPVLLCSVGLIGPAHGAFVDMDPDNFALNTVVDGNGATIRIWSATPPNPLSVWDNGGNKLYARSPLDSGGNPYLGILPSTGSQVFGIQGAANLHVSTSLGGNTFYAHVLFDNPTNWLCTSL